MSTLYSASPISFRVETDGKEVIANGIIHAPGGYVTFFLEDLKVIFRFADTIDKKRDVESRLTAEKELTINLINFNNALGDGTKELVPLGTINNKKLFVSFVVSAYFDMKRIEYNFYQGGVQSE